MNLQNRRLEPEWIDTLLPEDPRIERSRRDIRKIHAILGTRAWFQEQLKRVSASCPVVEIGAGDGWLARKLFPDPSSTQLTAIERAPRPPAWPSSWKWIQSDCLKLDWGPFDGTLIACMMLHHLDIQQLELLGTLIENSRIRRIFAIEPTRRRLHLRQMALADRFLHLHPVSRFDARVSIRAGFRFTECPAWMKLTGPGWDWSFEETFWGAYRLKGFRK